MKKFILFALITSLFTLGKSNETKVTLAEEPAPVQTYAKFKDCSTKKYLSQTYLYKYYADVVSVTVTNDFNKISAANLLPDVDPIEVGAEGTKTSITLSDGTSKDYYIAAYIAESTTKAQYSDVGYDLYFYANVDKIRPNDNASYQFAVFLEAITFTFDCLDTSHVTNMSHMFESCKKVASLDLSSFDTTQVTDMSNMFCYCNKLANIEFKNFDTSLVTNMNNMFTGTAFVSLDLSHFNTSNVKTMANMFSSMISLLSLDLTTFDMSNVTSMYDMFSFCKKVKQIKFSETVDTSKVETMYGLFMCCFELSDLDVSHFNTKNVKNFSYMFNGCLGLTSLSLTNFDTSSCENFDGMFSGMDELTYVDVSSFDLSKATSQRNSKLFEDYEGKLEVIIPPATLGAYDVQLPPQFRKYGYNTLNQLSGQERISIIPNKFAERWYSLRLAGGTQGICAALIKDSETRATYEALLQEYDAMDPNDKTTVLGLKDIEGVTIGETMTYLKEVLNGKATDGDYGIVVENNSDYNPVASYDKLAIVITLLAFGLMGCLGYYVFNKRKENN